jgi:hypothetical protein
VKLVLQTHEQDLRRVGIGEGTARDDFHAVGRLDGRVERGEAHVDLALRGAANRDLGREVDRQQRVKLLFLAHFLAFAVERGLRVPVLLVRAGEASGATVDSVSAGSSLVVADAGVMVTLP